MLRDQQSSVQDSIIIDPNLLIIEGLREDNAILSLRLSAIRNCSDSKCSLCSKCLAAVLPDRLVAEAPEVKEDDPIRNTGHLRKHRLVRSLRKSA